MAKKVQSNEAKAAYGNRFSQQDLTDPKDNQNPQFLVTPQSKSGGNAFLASLAGGLRLVFAGGGRSKTQTRKDKKVQ